MTNPKIADSIKLHHEFMLERTCPDSEEVITAETSYNEDNYEILVNLKNSPTLKLNQTEMNCFKFLAQMEKDIGWEALIELKCKIYFTEGEGYAENSFFTNSRPRYQQYYIQSNNSEENKISQDFNSKKISKIIEIESKSNVNPINSQININKRKPSKIDKLMSALNYDLANFHAWEELESAEKPNLSRKYSSLVWVYRGMLAERLARSNFAERAYKRAITFGTSLYSLQRLAEIYFTYNNLKSSISHIDQFLTIVQKKGAKRIDALPSWIEILCFKIIEKFGLSKFIEILKDYNYEQNSGLWVALDYAKKYKIKGLDK